MKIKAELNCSSVVESEYGDIHPEPSEAATTMLAAKKQVVQVSFVQEF